MKANKFPRDAITVLLTSSLIFLHAHLGVWSQHVLGGSNVKCIWL